MVLLGSLPVQASSIFFGGCSDGELIAAEAQTARSAVLPFHENLKLVGVPNDTQAANAGSALLDLISPVWDRVVPQLQLTLPRYARRKLADALPAPTDAGACRQLPL
jgi:hypothetical protein